MKKLITAILLACLALSGCRQSTTTTKADIIFLEDFSNSALYSYQDTVAAAVSSYCKDNNRTFTSFKLTATTKETLVNALDLAKQAAASLIIATPDFLDAVTAIHGDYPDLDFLMVDAAVSEAGPDAEKAVANLFSVRFNYYELGYLAGSLIPASGFNAVSFLDQSESLSSSDYIRGTLHGLQDALTGTDTHVAFNYYAAAGMDANAMNQVIYSKLITDTDTMMYFGDQAASLLAAYSGTSGTHYIGAGSGSGDNAVYYAYADYQKLLGAVLEDYVRKIRDQTNYVLGYRDQAVYLKYTAGIISSKALLAYQDLEASLNSQALTITDPADDLKSLALPNITLSFN